MKTKMITKKCSKLPFEGEIYRLAVEATAYEMLREHEDEISIIRDDTIILEDGYTEDMQIDEDLEELLERHLDDKDGLINGKYYLFDKATREDFLWDVVRFMRELEFDPN
jgi:hypothetical protein